MSTPSARRGNRLLEVTAVCILAVATLGSAWCAYQAAQWNGESTRLARSSSESRLEASRLFALATQTISYDTNTIGLYATAVASGDEVLADFYLDALVREAATPIVERWSDDIDRGRSPTPLLDDDEYLGDLLAPYEEASARAERASLGASDAGETANSYVLATVLLAVSLFFAGVTSSFRMRTVKIVLLAAAGFALAFAAANIADLDVL